MILFFDCWSYLWFISFVLHRAGIKNMRNTCFMSAILECFTHISQFVIGIRYCTHNFAPCNDFIYPSVEQNYVYNNEYQEQIVKYVWNIEDCTHKTCIYHVLNFSSLQNKRNHN
jgi:hypothetical protein